MKVGLFGLGRWGKVLYQNLIDNKDVDLVVVCDRHASNLSIVSKPTNTTTSFEEFLCLDFDVAVVATQPKSHFEHCYMLLNCGKNVFVEKPPCLNVQDVEVLEELADKNGVKIITNHIFMFSPIVRFLQEYDINVVKCYRCNEEIPGFECGVLENLSYHDIYLSLALLGCDSAMVCESDIVGSRTRFVIKNDGKMARIKSCYGYIKKIRELHVYGDGFYFIWNDCEDDNKKLLEYLSGRYIKLNFDKTTLELSIEHLVSVMEHGVEDNSIRVAKTVLEIVKGVDNEK